MSMTESMIFEVTSTITAVASIVVCFLGIRVGSAELFGVGAFSMLGVLAAIKDEEWI